MKINSVLSISLDVLLCILCMHACMTQKYEMTCYARKCLTDYDLMYALWRQGKHISNLIRFFANFLVESYYLDHLLFKQIYFVNENHFFIFNIIIFFQQHLFIPDMSFFLPLSFDIQKHFFRRMMNTTLIFSIFSFFFKIKHHPISRKK